MKETYAQASRAEDLKEKLDKLVDTNGRVKGSHEEVEVVIKELNDIMGTTYKLTGDQITLDGKLIKKKEDLLKSVDNYINKLKAEILVELSREKIQAIYERNLELKEKEKTLLDQLKEKSKNYHLEREDDAKKFYEENESLISQLRNIQGKIETNDSQLSLYAKGAMEAEKGHFEEAEKLMVSTAEQAKISIADIYGQLTDVFNEKITTELEVQLEIDQKAVTKAIKDTQKAFEKGGILGVQLYGSTGGNIGFANGGFPDAGQLFVAREAGPELVGRIGNRTAVVNNQQIVDAVAQGVKNAIITSGGFGKNKIVIEAHGDTDGMMNFITFKQKEQDMQYGN